MSMKKFFVGVKGIVQEERGILLLHREYKSGDFWDTPGGRIDDDEEFADTLRRELEEELPGIQVTDIGGLLGAHRVQRDIEEDTGLVLLYFSVQARLPEEVQLSEEHDGHCWINAKTDIPDQINPQLRLILEGLLA